MKARLLQHGVTAYSSSRVGSEDAVWDYMLTDPADIEDVFFESRSVENLTKMALARQLQLRDNLSDDVRNRQWSTLSKAHLTAAMLPVPPAGVAVLAAPAVALAAAPLGGRGRGARGGRGGARRGGRG